MLGKYLWGGGNSINQVFAIDSIYATYRPKCISGNITLSVDIFSALNSQQFDLIFMCDVLHHLDDEILERVLDAIKANGAKIIVIKDIDSRHRFGDFMNKTHDLLINNERVRSIFPNVLEDSLKSSGFNTEYFYLPKLWYPHFLLITQKEI